MFDIVLYQPEIPPNTGNLIRLAANTGARLHLVEPLGFDLSDKQLVRAGLDYHDMASVHVHADWTAVQEALAGRRWFALTTRGSRSYASVAFEAGDVLLFGPESRGLPADLLAHFDVDQRLRLPMLPGSRSLNLSNAVSVVVFEAWRQNGFAGGG
ncbi:RNA methyltransferase CspR [Thiobacillus denitrificans ATCC 25259]|uniref:tRNA (cytidine(34)-2'-O)-methyltransferase n=1 Tax=Thiobacillus denitrificans (strain ATCC 25259 / T1) TaxID=292415 RepID=Q3SG90_THIDA|nr:tRNA (cytidine(34)-2'-O)-methyltransferase [Thiobacillus denitrificans]AAZ98360.1 RNA methyltransferase CspR [Thiobacillus denitrificans ATCC 25259]